MATERNDYKGPGLYRVGKHGMVMYALTVAELDESMLKSELSDGDDEDELDIYEPGEGSLVYIEEWAESKNNLENIYEVRVINATHQPKLFDVYEAAEDSWYTGTDHSLFGSLNVILETKGKMEFKDC